MILFAAGLVLILAAVGADLINQELEPGFGFIQVAVVILGLLIMLAGAWLWFLHKYLKMRKTQSCPPVLEDPENVYFVNDPWIGSYRYLPC